MAKDYTVMDTLGYGFWIKDLSHYDMMKLGTEYGKQRYGRELDEGITRESLGFIDVGDLLCINTGICGQVVGTTDDWIVLYGGDNEYYAIYRNERREGVFLVGEFCYRCDDGAASMEEYALSLLEKLEKDEQKFRPEKTYVIYYFELVKDPSVSLCINPSNKKIRDAFEAARHCCVDGFDCKACPYNNVTAFCERLFAEAIAEMEKSKGVSNE